MCRSPTYLEVQVRGDEPPTLPPMRNENKGKIKNSETGAVLIKKIAIHIFLLQLKICTKIRGIFMLNPPPPPM